MEAYHYDHLDKGESASDGNCTPINVNSDDNAFSTGCNVVIITMLHISIVT